MEEDLADIVRIIARESASQRHGANVMLNRYRIALHSSHPALSDQQAEASIGWVRALRDQPICAALGPIRQSPERRWKIQELTKAALSRSAL